MTDKIAREQVLEVLELNTLQKGMLFHYLNEEQEHLYNVQLAFNINGQFNINLFGEAFAIMQQRHEALRTVFRWKNLSKPVQIFLKECPLDLLLLDMSGSLQLAEYLVKDQQERFDLEKLPLRVRIIKTGSESFVLTITHHHILYDGWSTGILLQELFACYRQLSGGVAPTLLPLPSYKQVYTSLVAKAAEQAGEDALYWRNYLQDYELKNSFEKKLHTTDSSPGTTTFIIPADPLDKFAASHKVTKAAIIYAAWGLMLQRYSNRSDVVFGTTVSGRDPMVRESDKIIGNFINTIPLRLTAGGEYSLIEVVQMVNSALIERSAYANLPYYELKKVLDLRSADDLFDTVVVVENYPLPEKLSVEAEIELRSVYENISFPLVISVFFRKNVQVELSYKKDFIDERVADTIATQLKTIITEIISAPASMISALSLLTKDEEEQLLHAFNDTAAFYPVTETIVSLFEQQVQRTPDHIALRYDDMVMSYRELKEQSDKVAAYLCSSADVQPGDLVGLMLEREINMIVSIFGILKSGGVYVPLSPGYPAERVNYIISDAPLKALITRSSHLQEGIRLPAGLIDLDQEWEDILKADIISDHQPDSHAVAYVIYTSGSTGKPKGVMVEHHAVINRICWMQKEYPISSTDMLLQKTPIVFDVSVWELFWWSFTGASLCLLKPGSEKDRQEIIHTISTHKVSVIHFVPSMLFSFLSGLDSLNGLATLRLVFSSGEALKATLVNQFAQLLQARLINLYGPTEATVDVSYYECDFKQELQAVPIGRPIDNIRLYILDAHGRLQPVGAPGELCIAGVGLARGYLNNEPLTKEKFIEHPALGRLYKTGDLSSWLPDGNILYLGRLDDQIKLRGFRIEPGEIASQLGSHPLVKEAVVISRERGDRHFLVAYYISSAPLEASVLKDHLSALLPDYMVPHHYVRLASLPLTGNGKLDRRALPEPELSTGHEQEAPATAEEELLSTVWCKVLGLAEVGVTDNFFSVGGDSIKSIQISSRLRTLGYDLTVKEVLTVPFIRGQALLLRALTQLSDQGAVEGTVPLTPIQQLFFDTPRIDPHHYNQSVMLHFPEGLSSGTARTIFEQLVHHHDALRMIYKGKVQSYKAETQVWLEEHDLRTSVEAGEKLALLAAGIQSGIDLANGPLLRLGLFHLEGGSHLLIVIHHLAVDGVSWRILFEDLTLLHQQLQQGLPLRLPMKTDSFQHWSVALEDYKASRYYALGHHFWSQQVVAPSVIKRDEEGRNLVGDTSTTSFWLDEQSTVQLLTSVHLPFNTRINDILLCSLYLALQEQYGHNSFTIDVEGHGREDLYNGVDVGRTIGWFTTLYPVLLKSDASALSGIIKQLKECVRQVPNNGFDYLLYKCEAGSTGSSILFNYLGQFDSDTSGHNWSLSTHSRGAEVSTDEARDYDWEIIGIVSGGRLEIRLTYSKAQYRSDTIGKLMASYHQHLLKVIGYCITYEKKEPSPSDYNYKALPLASLERLQQTYDIVDIYELSGMQEGMLFHTLLDREADHYFEQLTCHIHGTLNIQAVEKTLNALLDRYDSLRTVFIHEGHERPLQIVLKQRQVMFSYHDVRKEQNIAAIIQTHQAADRRQKFDLGKDVLIRLQVLRVGESEHVFIWSHHHIVMDGWCMSLLMRDFRSLYGMYANSSTALLPPVRLYGDYIAWLREQDLSLSADHWSAYLKGYEGLSTLPRHKGTVLKGYDQQQQHIRLTRDQTSHLTHYCSTGGITLNTVLQVAWGLLLGRYNNTDDVVFGSVVSGRPAEIEGVETMVGLFINTVPVRIQYKVSDSILDLLTRVQTAMAENVPHNHYALSSIGSHLFDHILIVENYPLAEELSGTSSADYIIDDIEIFEQTSYDLCLIVVPGDEISLQLVYNGHIYDAEIMTAVLSQFAGIISQLTNDAVARLSDIKLLGPLEEHQLLQIFNNTEASYPATATVMSLFEEQVQRTPDNIALRYDDMVMSYRELKEQSDKVAAYLRSSAGVQPGDLVGLMLEREINMIVSIFGILKSGGVYVPLSPGYPAERVNYIISDAKLKALITRSSHLQEGVQLPAGLIDLDQDWEDILNEDTAHYQPGSCSLAYVIYTSGSTGRPKGVMVEHHALSNIILYLQKKYPLQERDNYLLKTTCTFDVSLTEIFGWYLNGGSLSIPPPGTEKELTQLLEYIATYQVTHMNFVPSMFAAFVEELKKEGIEKIASLHYIFLAGEMLPKWLVEEFRSLNTGIALENIYGPTEGTIYSCGYSIQTLDDLTVVPIGRPLDNIRLHILDAHGSLQPVGAPGELCIAGVGLARGYLNNEPLTKEKFIEHPVLGRLYKTGDLSSWLPDGNILYLGRLDDQIKLRGFRIEPGEIASQLSSHPLVKEAVVISRERGDSHFLVAYYISSAPLEASVLKDHLSALLPDYMVPHHYVRLASLPLTGSGKLDRRALPEPELSTGDVQETPATAKEKLLSEVWCKVLGLTNVGVTDNFFSVGGDSIKSIQISSRLRTLGYDLTVKEVLTVPNIRGQALLLRALTQLSDQGAVEGTVQLTPIQQLFFDNPRIHPHHYNQSVMLHFPEGLTSGTIRTIFEELLRHHDALRLVFDGEVQSYNADTAVWLEEHDLRLSAEELSQFTEHIQSGIDLVNGPLLRLGLFHLEDGSHLLIVIHHLVVDGVSWRILFEDFTQLLQGMPLSLPMKTDSFQRWSAAQQDYKESRYYALGRHYWSQQVVVPSVIKRDEEGRNLVGDTSTTSFWLDEQSTSQLLTSVHIPFNTRINDILLCGLYLSLQEQYGHNRMTIDVEGHGRENLHNGVDVGRTIGWFTTLYPVLLESDTSVLSGMIKQLKECVRQVPNNGFDYLLYRSETGLSGFSSSPILFNYLGQFDSDTSGHSWSLSTQPRGAEVSAAETRDYDWEIIGIVNGGRLELQLIYSKAQYHVDTIAALMNSYQQHLLKVIDYCLSYGKEECSPSDYNYKALPLASLERLQQIYEIADIYELSGMQEGMLFHTLLDRDADHYFEQLTCHVHGTLNIQAVEQTLNALLDRYDSLRTVFIHEGHDRPLQIVLKQRQAMFSYHDVSKEQDIAAVIKIHQAADRRQKFDLSKDGLIRLQVLEVGESEYVFIWSHHHIVMDGWCMSLLMRDFRSLYGMYTNSSTALLPPVRPYGDYIAWLREQDLSLSADYWSAYLQGYEGLATIPQHEGTGYDQQQQHIRLTRDQTSHLTHYCSIHGITLNTVLQVAWGVLLGRYNNTSDVVFGSVVSGRPAEIEGVEMMVGLFINTVPVRIQFQEGDTVLQLLTRVQAAMVEGVPHNHYALSSIGSHLFDHILIVENYPLAEELSGTSGADYVIDDIEIFEQTNYNLCLVVVPGEEISLRLAYNSLVYDTDRMKAVLSQLEKVITEILDKPACKINKLSILTKEEEHQLIHIFNNTATSYPATATVISLFEKQVEQTPDNTALIFGSNRYTYRQLNNFANDIAGKIINQVPAGNPRIGLLFTSSVEMIAAIWAVMKAGGTYIPLSSAAPPERNNHILVNSDAQLVLTQPSLVASVGKAKFLSIEMPADPDAPTQNPVHTITPESLLYIIYTSGTTGNPKGVEVPNRGVVNYISWRIKTYGFTAEDITLQLLPYYFDAYGAGLYAALLSGGTLVIVDEEERLSPGTIAGIIRKEKVTCTGITPLIYDIVLNELATKQATSSLRIVALGGEKIAAEIVQKSKRFLPDVVLHNEYGPTEASVTTTHNYLHERNTDIIGKPISNMEVHILGKNLELLPIGVYGELCIAGTGIANGYTKNKTLTKEKFVPHPFREDKVMYRSGDLACWLPDGTIRLRGRMDDQVKIRGFRIEPAEIEEQLHTHPGIRKAVVVVKDREGEKCLAAYYVADNEVQATVVRKYLAAKLPDYMVPAWLVQLKALPLTANGKLDVKALPDPEINITESYIAASGQMEETLVKIWAEILKLDVQKISVDANFFDLGGHSIHMMNLTSRVNQHFGSNISVAAMFGMPAIRMIAEHLSNGGRDFGEMNAHIEADWQEAEKNLEIFNQLHDQ